MIFMKSSENNLTKNSLAVRSDDQSTPSLAIIRRVEMACGLFETAFEIKTLELRRRNPEATDAWIRDEALRLIEVGCR